MEEINFVEYNTDFLVLSWDWLNDPEIKQLTNTPDFTKEAQEKWFETLKDKQDYKVWGIEYNNMKIGVVGLKNIFEQSAEYFGYIGNKQFWNKGISKNMLDHVLTYAKKNWISRLELKVIKNNLQAIRAYQKYGFVVYEEKDNELIMRLQT